MTYEQCRIIFVQNSSTKLFSKSRNRYSYFSRLSLSKVSYFDIGYYYCGPSVIDIKFFEPNFKKIYVYVQGEYLSKNNGKIYILKCILIDNTLHFPKILTFCVTLKWNQLIRILFLPLYLFYMTNKGDQSYIFLL